MDNLPDYSVQEETRQLQKMQFYQKLVLFTLFRYKWSIMLVFAVVLLLGALARYVQFNRSPYRFESSITLFYTPRASEEVKPLSINHILGIFSRQSVYRQVIEDMQLNDKQKAVLRGAIEVELVRDRFDMFTITGKGESEKYVQQLLNTFAAAGCRKNSCLFICKFCQHYSQAGITAISEEKFFIHQGPYFYAIYVLHSFAHLLCTPV